MSDSFPPLPDISCRYERYDSETLKPINDSTYIRLIETGWTEAVFRAKSVLDIGCNSGILSLFAHDLGAGPIRSIDVQDPFVAFFSAVVQRHNLPITVAKKAFNHLTPAEDGADIVLCMEVLHWLVHQGGTIPDAVARLAALTRETLFIETPWDVKEPSIADKKGFTEDNYNIELILRELARHFEEVRVVRFMTYFGSMINSKRVLITAAGKRTATLPIRHLGDANHTGISMSRGTNPMVMLTTPTGPKALKSMPANSAFVRLEEADLEALCGFLGSVKGSPIVAPERLGDAFRQREADGQTYMLFPFVGQLGEYFPKPMPHKPVRAPMDLALGVFRHFTQAGPDLVAALRKLNGRLPAYDYRALPKGFAPRIEQEGLGAFLDQVAETLRNYDPAQEDALLHNDLQMGNMVGAPGGRDWVVDIDLIRAGPCYADIFSCAIHTGADAATLTATLKAAEPSGPRPPDRFDMAFSTGSSLLWLRTILERQGELPERVVARYLQSLKTMRDLGL